MSTEPISGSDIMRRLRCAAGHLQAVIEMTETGEPCEQVLYQLNAVRAAFHGTYWHNDYGRPSSRGCINLTPNDAKFIYRWTLPEVPNGVPYLNRPGEGTPVQIIVSGQ